jgi:hypothetical protein
MKGEKLVTVATFQQTIEAHLARLRLQSYGIECVVLDEEISGMNGFHTDPEGGIKLQVLETDAKEARRLLAVTKRIAK